MIGEAIILVGTVVKLVEEYCESKESKEITYDPKKEKEKDE